MHKGEELRLRLQEYPEIGFEMGELANIGLVCLSASGYKAAPNQNKNVLKYTFPMRVRMKAL